MGTPQISSRPERDEAAKGHARQVQKLFSRIAGVYDLLNHVLSLGLDILWRKRLTKAIGPFPAQGTGVLLDLAAGTMDVSVELGERWPHRTILAVDFCPPMLRKGRPKLKKSKARIYPLAGDGRSLPLRDNSVDAVTIAFGLRNIRPRREAYAEMLRVLTPGGRLCVLEFGSAHDRILFGLYNWYLMKVLPCIGSLISRDKGAYRYLAETVQTFPSADALAAEMEEAGFARVRHTAYTAGIVCLHIGQKNVSSR